MWTESQNFGLKTVYPPKTAICGAQGIMNHNIICRTERTYDSFGQYMPIFRKTRTLVFKFLVLFFNNECYRGLSNEEIDIKIFK